MFPFDGAICTNLIGTSLRIGNIRYGEMAKDTINRVWNRIENRYERDSNDDCCGISVEEVPSESTGDESEDDSEECCE